MSPNVRVESSAFLEPPGIGAMHHELLARREIILQSFSALELAAVAAGSPLRGLLATTEMLALDDASTEAGLIVALHGLTERGLVAPSVAEEGRGNEESHGIALPLGGDLAMVTAIRRHPALMGVVTVTGSTKPEGAVPVAPFNGVIGVLHGLAIEGVGLVGLLEESLAPDSWHHFVMSTPERQAQRILKVRRALVADLASNPVQIADRDLVLAVDLYVPDETQPRHTRLTLTDLKDGGEAIVVALDPDVQGVEEQRIPISDNGQEWVTTFEKYVDLER